MAKETIKTLSAGLTIRNNIQTARRQDHIRHCGFSLLELLVVMILMGLISAFVIPQIGDSLAATTLRTSAKKTLASLRYARDLAATQRRNCWVVFNSQRNTMIIDAFSTSEQETSGPEPEGESTDNPFKPQPKMYRFPDGVQMDESDSELYPTPNDEKGIVFFPSGSSSGGNVVLVDKRERQITVTVDLLTGMPEIIAP